MDPETQPAAQPNGQTDWREGLPEDLRAAPALQDIADIPALAKSFVETKAFAGNAIRPPGPEASEEQRADFYRKLQQHAPDLIPKPNPDDPETLEAVARAMGKPAEATAYVAPQTAEGSLPIDETRLNAFRELAHKASLSQKQFDGIVTAEIARQTEEHNAHVAKIKESHLDLQRDWGLTYDDRSKKASAFAAQTGAPKPLLDALEKGQIDGATMKWLYGLSEAVGGESREVGDQPGAPAEGHVDPTEANMRVAEITDQLSKLSPQDPKYAILIKKRIDYLKQANPQAATSLDNLRAGAGTFEVEGMPET